MCAQLLDRYDVDVAILTGEEAIEVSTLANPHYAQALARAYNDWLVEEWLPRDRRLRGSLVIAPQDRRGAADEIRRLSGHPGIVQVLVSTGAQRPYGDPFYEPIWEACAEHGLPVAAHLGGQGGVNANPTGCGPSTSFLGSARAAVRDGDGSRRQHDRPRDLRALAGRPLRVDRVRHRVATGPVVAS